MWHVIWTYLLRHKHHLGPLDARINLLLGEVVHVSGWKQVAATASSYGVERYHQASVEARHQRHHEPVICGKAREATNLAPTGKA